MLRREHSAILLTFIKLPFVTNTFVLSIFEWLLKTGFKGIALYKLLTRFILLDYPIHIDTISMELSIFNFKVVPVKISVK